MTTAIDLALAGLAAAAAGAINAVAGGGTLVSFPALVALGVPAVSANVTNTVALCPGYFGAARAQRGALAAHRDLLRRALPVAGVGGLVGSVLLVVTSESVFRNLVPFLILLACALLGFQDRIKRFVVATGRSPGASPPITLLVGVFGASVYGGYFGAGLGIMLLAVMGLALDDPLNELNAMKSLLALAINVMAALFFVFSGKVAWEFAAVMAPASLLGGHVGGLVAWRMNAKVLRAVVITFGVAVAVRMLL